MKLQSTLQQISAVKAKSSPIAKSCFINAHFRIFEIPTAICDVIFFTENLRRKSCSSSIMIWCLEHVSFERSQFTVIYCLWFSILWAFFAYFHKLVSSAVWRNLHTERGTYSCSPMSLEDVDSDLPEIVPLVKFLPSHMLIFL